MILAVRAERHSGVLCAALPTSARLIAARDRGEHLQIIFEVTSEPGTFAYRDFVIGDITRATGERFFQVAECPRNGAVA